MITYQTNEFNHLTQELYEKQINQIHIELLVCPCCGHIGGCTIHGYYTRSVKNPEEKAIITVMRVKCQYCNHTHSLLPCSVCPYSQILEQDQMKLIQDEQQAMQDNPELIEADAVYVKEKYNRCFREKLISIGLVLGNIVKIIEECFKAFGTNFMQSHHIYNALEH